MAPLSLPWLELARFRRSLLTRLALVVIVVLPTLYAGLYLAANWDPIGRLGRLPAAVVNQDRPATTTGNDGTVRTVSAGAEIVTTLTRDGAGGFDWRATSAAEAAGGLRDGRYAAVLTIPAAFSADLASLGGPQPRRATLAVATDDANNYILGSVANTLTTNLRDSLAASTTGRYLDNVFLAFNGLHEQTGKAADGATKLAEGAQAADRGAGALVVGLGRLGTGAGELADGTSALSAGAGRLADGTGRLAAGATTAATGAGLLSAGLDTLRHDTRELPAQTGRLATGAADVATGADRVADGTEQLAAGTERLVGAVGVLATAPPALTELGGALGQAADTVDAARGDLRTDVLTQVRALAAADPDNARLQRLLADVQRIDADLAPTLRTVADRLRAGSTAAGQLGEAGTRLGGSVRELDRQVDQLATGARQVATGATQVADGNRRLAESTPALTDGIAAASAGARSLAGGTAQVAAGVGAADTGARRLATGAGQLDTGAEQVAAGAGDARQGARQLADGTRQLATGSGELADGLHAGAGKIPTYDDADRAARAGTVAEPVDARRERHHAVAHYGEGLAPFFLALALWIGGMVTYMVLRAVSKRALASTASTWRAGLSGWLPGAGFAVVQAAVLLAVLVGLLGLRAPNLLATTAFAIGVAVVFASIHQCLIALFGGVGRLVALVLLMLQLTSAGGTYPADASPAFFRALHPFLPFTYAVRGLRNLIAGGPTDVVLTSAAALLGFAVLAIGGTLFACHQARTWSVTRLHPSLSL